MNPTDKNKHSDLEAIQRLRIRLHETSSCMEQSENLINTQGEQLQHIKQKFDQVSDNVQESKKLTKELDTVKRRWFFLPAKRHTIRDGSIENMKSLHHGNNGNNDGTVKVNLRLVEEEPQDINQRIDHNLEHASLHVSYIKKRAKMMEKQLDQHNSDIDLIAGKTMENNDSIRNVHRNLKRIGD